MWAICMNRPGRYASPISIIIIYVLAIIIIGVYMLAGEALCSCTLAALLIVVLEEMATLTQRYCSTTGRWTTGCWTLGTHLAYA